MGHPELFEILFGAAGGAELDDDPGEVAALEEPDACVDGDDVTVAHGGEIEEGLPGHWVSFQEVGGISREDSMAFRAASCSAS